MYCLLECQISGSNYLLNNQMNIIFLYNRLICWNEKYNIYGKESIARDSTIHVGIFQDQWAFAM